MTDLPNYVPLSPLAFWQGLAFAHEIAAIDIDGSEVGCTDLARVAGALRAVGIRTQRSGGNAASRQPLDACRPISACRESGAVPVA